MRSLRPPPFIATGECRERAGQGWPVLWRAERPGRVEAIPDCAILLKPTRFVIRHILLLKCAPENCEDCLACSHQGGCANHDDLPDKTRQWKYAGGQRATSNQHCAVGNAATPSFACRACPGQARREASSPRRYGHRAYEPDACPIYVAHQPGERYPQCSGKTGAHKGRPQHCHPQPEDTKNVAKSLLCISSAVFGWVEIAV